AVATLTDTARPTAVPLVDRPPARAMFWRPQTFVDLISIASDEVTCAPCPIHAFESKKSTWMPTDAATLASPLPPAPARPQAMKSFSFGTGVPASTVPAPRFAVGPPPIGG